MATKKDNFRVYGTAETNALNPVALCTIAVDTGATVRVTGEVIMQDASGATTANGGTYLVCGGFQNIGGTVSQMGATSLVTSSVAGTETTQPTLNASGGNVILQADQGGESVSFKCFGKLTVTLAYVP